MNTFKTIEEAMQDIMWRRLDQDLIRVSIIYLSPVTKMYEYRVAYFHEKMEADIWEKFITSEYDKLGIKYTVYQESNGEI